MGVLARLAAACVVVLVTLPVHGRADSAVEAFYKGRTVDFIVGYGTGGGYDTYSRVLAPFLSRKLPGAPQVVIRNMPGASSLNALRFIATTAPRDGSALGMFNPTILTMAVLEPAKAKIDFGALTWIGNMSSDTKTCVVRAGLGLEKLEDLKVRRVSIGATSQGSGAIYGAILKRVFGDNVQVVMGYPSTNDIALAMERGEVDGMCTGWGTIELTKPDWVKRASVRALTQFAETPDKRIPAVPRIHDAALPSGLGAAITFLTLPDVVTRPVVAPPGLPVDRAQALRRAFDAVLTDAEFLAFAAKGNLDIDATTGEDLARIVERIVATPPDALEFARKLYN